MKKTSLMLLFLMPLLALAQRITPIEGGRLVNSLNGNQKAITNLQYVQVGTTTVNQAFLNSLAQGEVIDYGPRISLLEANSNDWTTAYRWGNHANDISTVSGLVVHAQADATQALEGLATKPNYQSVTGIVNGAIAAMPEVKTYRLWDTSNHWYEVAGATVTEYWVDTSTGWVLNIAELEFSAPEAIPYPMSNFENLSLGIPAPYDWVTAGSYYSEGIGHHFTIIDGSGVYQWYDAYLNGNETEITLPGVDGPPTLVFVYSTTYTTNVAQHVFITPAQALEYASHVGDSAVHVGATDRTNWDGKLDRLNGVATNSVLVNASVTDTFTLFSYQWSWNADRGTYDVALPGGVVGQLFQEQHAYCRNQTGSTIANGKLVCSAGAIGDNAAIRLFDPTDLTCAWGLIGMVTVDAGIAHGSNGQVTTLGEVNNLNTSMFAVSNRLWATTAGDVTNVEPAVAVGFLKYYVGIVLRSHPTEGRIYFNPQYCPNVTDVGAISATGVSNIVIAAINENKSSSMSSFTPITDITTGATVTVVWNSSPYIAYVQATTPFTLTNQIPTLDCTSQMVQRVQIDYLGSNALSTVWDARINWGGQTPELSVTGRYEFVFSTICGNKIIGKQVYPSIKPWSAPNGTAQGGFLTIGSATNSSTLISPANWTDSRAYIFEFRFQASTNAWLYNLIERGYAIRAILGPIVTGKNLFRAANIQLSATYPFAEGGGFSGVGLPYELAKTVSQGNNATIPVFCRIREMNELEFNAYNAGWRP